MRPIPATLSTLLIVPLAFGCDKAEAEQKEASESASEAKVEARYTVAATDLDLEATVALIEREDVRDAESVEALLNAEDSPVQLDVDEDGQRDFVSVHEVAEVRAKPANTEAELDPGETVEIAVDDGAKARFELRVIPSSTLSEAQAQDAEAVVEVEAETEAVVVATLDFEVDVEAKAVVVEAAYAPVVVIAEDSEVERVYVHHIEIHDHHDEHIVVAAPFVAWVWLGARPIYVGHHHLPPGHAKKLGLHWHHGPHHGHHGHGHHGDVKVKHHGGGSHKTHVKVKHKSGHGGGSHGGGSHGGGGHVKVKAKAKAGHGGGGGGGGKFKAKGKGK